MQGACENMNSIAKGDLTMQTTGQFKAAGLGNRTANTVATSANKAPQAATAGSGGGDGTQKKQPKYNVKFKGPEGKYIKAGAIFENTITVNDRNTGEPTEVVTQTLSVSKDQTLVPGVFYSIFLNDFNK